MTASSVTPVLRRSSVLVALAIAAMTATTAHADTIIFQSNLSNVTTPSPSPNGKNFQLGVNGGSVAGITNTFTSGTTPGLNLVYAEGTPNFSAFSLGASTASPGQPLNLDNAIVADPFDSHDGGAFLALDSVFQQSAIDISVPTISGMTYVVTFDWGGTQQRDRSGATTDFLTVGFTGNVSKNTSTINVASQGFTGWFQATDTFTASTTGTSILSFLATGTPTEVQPAFTLLDNIAVTQKTTTPTPEPGSLMLLSTGLIGLGSFVRSRYNKN